MMKSLRLAAFLAAGISGIAQAADMEAVLDSADGSSAFVVKDSSNQAKFRIGSDGSIVVTQMVDRGSGSRSIVQISGGGDVEIGTGANGYLQGVAIGLAANAHSDGVAIGQGATGPSNGVAVGRQAVGANSGVAVGYHANGDGESVAVGYHAAGLSSGVALGHRASSLDNGVAAGRDAVALSQGVAIGQGANAAASGVAIGFGLTNDVENSVRVRGPLYLDGGTSVLFRATAGSGDWTPMNNGDFMADGSVPMSGNLDLSNMALTNVARVDFSTTATALGSGAIAGSQGSSLGFQATSDLRGTSIGYNSQAIDSGVAVGARTKGDTNGVAIGIEAWGYNEGLAIGEYSDGYYGGVSLGNKANGARTNVAIGYRANARGGINRIAIGLNVSNQVNNSAQLRGNLYLDGATGIMTRASFGEGAWTVKAFTIDHPLDPDNKVLRHYALEGPEVWNVYAGNAQLVGGEAVVELPDYYGALNLVGSEVYGLTPIGALVPVAIKSEVAGNRFSIMAAQDVKVSWTIQVRRNDAACLQDLRRRPAEQLKDELHPGQAAAENAAVNSLATRPAGAGP